MSTVETMAQGRQDTLQELAGHLLALLGARLALNKPVF